MYPWCVGKLLALSRLDARVSLSLYENGFYPHAFFYLHQSLEKLVKAFIVVGEPEELRRKVNEKIIEYARKGKSFNVEDLLCSEVLKYSVGHSAAWKFISWMANQYSRTRSKIQEVLHGNVPDDVMSFIDELVEITGFNLRDLRKTYDELTGFYGSLHRLVDEVSREVLSNGEITDLDKVFEGIRVLYDFTIKAINEIREEFKKIDDLDYDNLYMDVDVCRELRKNPHGRKFLELIRVLASKQGSDPEEAVRGICRVLPCIYEYIVFVSRKIVGLGQIYALIPLAAFLEKVKAHELSRYPISEYISPLDIKKEHLDSIRFREIISLVIDSVDKLEDCLLTIHNVPKKLSKCASSINGTPHLASSRA